MESPITALCPNCLSHPSVPKGCMDERTSHCPYIPWGLRDGTDSWDRGLQMGLHGMSSHCPYILWGLRDGMDSWDRGLQMGLHGMSSHCPYNPLRDCRMGWTVGTEGYRWDSMGGLQMGLHGMSSHCQYIPWGLWNETDSWNRGLQMVPCHRTHGSPKFPLDSDTIKGICPNCPSHPSVPKLSVHPLGTEGWDGQLGQRPVIGDSTGCPFTVRTSLRD